MMVKIQENYIKVNKTDFSDLIEGGHSHTLFFEFKSDFNALNKSANIKSKEDDDLKAIKELCIDKESTSQDEKNNQNTGRRRQKSNPSERSPAIKLNTDIENLESNEMYKAGKKNSSFFDDSIDFVADEKIFNMIKK